MRIIFFGMLAAIYVSKVEANELDAIEWFPEPSAFRVLNQAELTGVIRDPANIDLTQIFTAPSSGALSAVGIALGAPGGTPSLKISVHRVTSGVVDPLAFDTSIRSENYFAGIGPQTVPVWVYGEFSSLSLVKAGEQVALRIESPRAELWGPRSDVLPGGELIEIPGTDLAFRVYLTSLAFKLEGQNLVLEWPSSITNGAVEATISPHPGTTWETIHTIDAGTNRYSAPINGEASFFRLSLP